MWWGVKICKIVKLMISARHKLYCLFLSVGWTCCSLQGFTSHTELEKMIRAIVKFLKVLKSLFLPWHKVKWALLFLAEWRGHSQGHLGKEHAYDRSPQPGGCARHTFLRAGDEPPGRHGEYRSIIFLASTDLSLLHLMSVMKDYKM